MSDIGYLKRTWAEIDLDRIRENFKIVRDYTPKSAEIISVVKADAYGHGADTVARVLSDAGSDAFAVSNIEEGVLLRKSGIDKPILILGTTPVCRAPQLLSYNLATTVTSYVQARELADAAGARICVHIKADTGMGRLGITCTDESEVLPAADECARICALAGLEVKGIFTHFAVADEQNDDLTPKQFARFCALLAELERRGIHIPTKHCSNSAALLRYPQYALNAVRPGVALYGLPPDSCAQSGIFGACGLKPAMTLKTCVMQVKHLKAGDTVSYGAVTLEKDTNVGVIGVGYADGYSRRLSGRGFVMANGVKLPIIGKICMDMTMIDLENSGITPGTEAILFGYDRKTGKTLEIERIAELAGTISYELLCDVGRRVTRVYIENGREIKYNGLLGS